LRRRVIFSSLGYQNGKTRWWLRKASDRGFDFNNRRKYFALTGQTKERGAGDTRLSFVRYRLVFKSNEGKYMLIMMQAADDAELSSHFDWFRSICAL
jgi:hypothetical protein